MHGECSTGGGNSTLFTFSEENINTATTTTYEPVTTIPPDCNYAVWVIYPFVDGECSYIEDSNDGFGSIMAECASNIMVIVQTMQQLQHTIVLIVHVM